VIIAFYALINQTNNLEKDFEPKKELQESKTRQNSKASHRWVYPGNFA